MDLAAAMLPHERDQIICRSLVKATVKPSPSGLDAAATLSPAPSFASARSSRRPACACGSTPTTAPTPNMPETKEEHDAQVRRIDWITFAS